jgi:hypothetical protein
MGVTFITEVRAMTEKATTLPVPAEAVGALGTQKKPKVVVSVNNYTYRSTVQTYGGEFLLPFSATDREAAGVKAGDQVQVTLDLDLEPRTIEVPAALTAALAQQPGAMEAFAALAYSKRKEFVRQVNEARTQETRDRRIAGILATLGAA